MEGLEQRLLLTITTASDSYGSVSNATLAIPDYAGVLANDSDSGGATLTAALVSGPSHGTLSLYTDGGFSYTNTPTP